MKSLFRAGCRICSRDYLLGKRGTLSPKIWHRQRFLQPVLSLSGLYVVLTLAIMAPFVIAGCVSAEQNNQGERENADCWWIDPPLVKVEMKMFLVRVQLFTQQGQEVFLISSLGEYLLDTRRVKNNPGLSNIKNYSSSNLQPWVTFSCWCRVRWADDSKDSVIVEFEGEINETPFKLQHKYSLPESKPFVHILPFNEIFFEVPWLVLWEVKVESLEER